MVIQDGLFGTGLRAHTYWAGFRSCIDGIVQRSAEILILLLIPNSNTLMLSVVRTSSSHLIMTHSITPKERSFYVLKAAPRVRSAYARMAALFRRPRTPTRERRPACLDLDEVEQLAL